MGRQERLVEDRRQELAQEKQVLQRGSKQPGIQQLYQASTTQASLTSLLTATPPLQPLAHTLRLLLLAQVPEEMSQLAISSSPAHVVRQASQANGSSRLSILKDLTAVAKKEE